MVYGGAAGRIILFGGWTGAAVKADTWTYGSATNAWANMTTSSGPAGRMDHAMAYHSGAGKIVLFGGYTDAGFNAETWVYDLASNTWTNVTPSVGPAGRVGHSIVYHPPSGRIILFGGYLQATGPTDDTWAYDLGANTWTNMAPANPPAARAAHAMAYDPTLGLIVLFGGSLYVGRSDETWGYDPNANVWVNLLPVGRPSARSMHVMGYDSWAGRVVVFGGGTSGGYNAETWAYDSTANLWTNMEPTSRPSPRYLSGMAFDAGTGHFVLFGGWTGPLGQEVSDDVWTYNLTANQWRNMPPIKGPSGRYGHAMVYDTDAGRSILFGGFEVAGHSYETWAYDFAANTWTNTAPMARPNGRGWHAMAYHAPSNRVILFSGLEVAGVYPETWAYDFATNTWANMAPAVSPSGREEHAMAYDPRADKIILFGGWKGPGMSSETWAYDFVTNTWTNMAPTAAPLARYGHAMVYDPRAGGIVLFGGWSDAGMSDETWLYNFTANIWTNMAPTTRPSAREGHSMAYDVALGRIVLFGGAVGWGGPYVSETWTYDIAANAWREVTSGTRLSGRSWHAMAYDAVAGRTVLFGGYTNWGLNDETWAYDSAANEWTKIAPNREPSPRFGHAMVYDAGVGQSILFGGNFALDVSNETWAYDLASNLWTKMNPTMRPSGRYDHAMAYDARAGRIVLFGGWTMGGLSSETWAYDSATETWTKMAPITSPSARFLHAMVYDATTGLIVLFGGWLAEGTESNETWTYDLSANSWAKLAPAQSPSARFGHAMIYDETAGRVILFGGRTNLSSSAETWSYDSATNTWMNLTPVFGPSARTGHVMTFDADSGRAILFGGNTDMGDSDETWAYDSPENRWTNMAPSPSPSSRSGHAMAYDVAAGQTVLFGGWTAAGFSAETWLYDYSPVPPSAPRNLRATAGDREVVLVWEAPVSDGGSPLTGYTIYRGTISGDLSLVASVGNVLAYTDTDLANGMMYYYQVAAVSVIGEGQRSGEVSATPQGAPPAAPSAPLNLAGTAGSGQVALTWQAPASDGGSAILGYRIYRGTAPGGLTFLVQVGDTLTYVDAGLAGGQIYYYAISAVNGIGEGPLSGQAMVALPTTPSAPLSLEARAGIARVDLTWQPPASTGGAPVIGYRIYRGVAPGALALHVQVGNVSSYADTGLTNGQTYYYAVSALSVAGEGPHSIEVSASLPTVPSVPQAVQAIGGSERIDLAWQPPATDGGAALLGFRIYRGTEPGNCSFLLQVGIAPAYADLAVTSGIAYYYQVSAVNVVGEGPLSSPTLATPSPRPDTTKPSITITFPTSSSVLSSRTVTVTGTAWDDVALEKVELSTDGTTWILASGTASWSGLLSLQAGSSTIFVRAIDTSGNIETISLGVTVEGAGLGAEIWLVALIAAPLVAAAAIFVLLGLRSWRR